MSSLLLCFLFKSGAHRLLLVKLLVVFLDVPVDFACYSLAYIIGYDLFCTSWLFLVSQFLRLADLFYLFGFRLLFYFLNNILSGSHCFASVAELVDVPKERKRISRKL